jgi:HK97 family phage portal protein
MGFRSRLGAAWRGFTKDSGSGNPHYDALAAFADVYGTNQSKSGQSITFSTALQVSTVFACVRVLADGVAQVPLKLLRERPDGRGSDLAKDHPLYYVLHRRPNPWQTSFRFRETMMLHLVLCSNFFAFKNRVGKCNSRTDPDRAGAGRSQTEPRSHADLQRARRVGEQARLSARAILHLRGPSWNSWMGMEAVKLAREAIGLSMAIEADQAKLYKNGLRTSGTYSVEGTLTPEQYKGLRKFIKEFQANDSGEPLILDRAAKYISDVMKGVDAQTLEARGFQVEETCRPFRVMPIMIGHADKTATYASAVQMFLAHVVHGLMPWYERLQQDFDEQLLDDTDVDLHFKFIEHGLLRGSFDEQAQGFAKALGAGGSPAWMTPNEVRERLDMNPIDGGDELPKPPQATPPPAKVPAQ